jgi:hypothetical protein
MSRGCTGKGDQGRAQEHHDMVESSALLLHTFFILDPRGLSRPGGQQGLCRHAVSRTARLGASITTFQPASATTLHTVRGAQR